MFPEVMHSGVVLKTKKEQSMKKRPIAHDQNIAPESTETSHMDAL